MPARIIASVVLVGLFSQASRAQDKLYTTTGTVGQFVRSNLDGSDFEVIFTHVANPGFSQIVPTVQINPINKQLYWGVSTAEGGIWTLRPGEAPPVRLTSRSSAFVLDPIVQRLYTSGIDSLSLDGTFLAPLTRAFTESMAGAPGHEWIYWYGGLFENPILRVRTDGSLVETLVELPEQAPWGISVDALNNKLYWVDQHGSGIHSLDMDTGEINVVAQVGIVGTTAIDVARQHLYGTLVGGRVFRVDLANGEVTHVLPFLDRPIALALLLECGNLRVDEGETCDIYIPEGEAGSCPRSCPEFDQEPCTRNTLRDKNTCSARCELIDITEPRNFDGCCPPGGIEGRDTDCGVPFTVPAMSGVGQAVLIACLLAMIAVRFRKTCVRTS